MASEFSRLAGSCHYISASVLSHKRLVLFFFALRLLGNVQPG
jgi:hypothetical protein